MAKYLGKVTGLITAYDLHMLIGGGGGGLTYTDDITWLKFRYNGKTLLICDRTISDYNCSPRQLEELGVIKGKNITINGNNYLCRSIKGATSDTYPHTSTLQIGREWKDLIMQFTPNLEDSHWDIGTICYEVNESGFHLVVGHSSLGIGYGTHTSSTSFSKYEGFRPVLEIPNNVPVITTKVLNLGEIKEPQLIKYSIEDLDNDLMTVTIKLDNNVIQTLYNQSNAELTFNLSDIWDSINYGNHTIEIVANDSYVDSGTVSIRFNKINEPTPQLSEDASLTQLLNHLQNIKVDKIIERDRLATNLANKDVEVLETDKMSDLVGKVDLLDKKKPIPDDLINSRDLISFSMGGLSPGIIRIPNSWIFLDPSTYVNVRSYNFQTMVSGDYDVGGLRGALRLDFDQIVNYKNDTYLISGGYPRVCHWDTKTFEDLTAIHGRRDYNRTILVQHPQKPNLLYIYEQSQNNSTRYFKIYDMDVRAIIHSSSNISSTVGSGYVRAISPVGNDFVYLVSDLYVFRYDLNTNTVSKITTSELSNIAKPGSIASPPSSFSILSFGGYLTDNSMWLLFNYRYLFTLNLTNMELIGRSRTIDIKGYMASDSILISGSQSVNTGIHFLDYDKLKNYLK